MITLSTDKHPKIAQRAALCVWRLKLVLDFHSNASDSVLSFCFSKLFYSNTKWPWCNGANSAPLTVRNTSRGRIALQNSQNSLYHFALIMKCPLRRAVGRSEQAAQPIRIGWVCENEFWNKYGHETVWCDEREKLKDICLFYFDWKFVEKADTGKTRFAHIIHVFAWNTVYVYRWKIILIFSRANSCLFHMFARMPFCHRMKLVWVSVSVCLFAWHASAKCHEIEMNSNVGYFDQLFATQTMVSVVSYVNGAIPLGEIQAAKVPTLNHSKNKSMTPNKCSIWLPSHANEHIHIVIGIISNGIFHIKCWMATAQHATITSHSKIKFDIVHLKNWFYPRAEFAYIKHVYLRTYARGGECSCTMSSTQV